MDPIAKFDMLASEVLERVDVELNKLDAKLRRAEQRMAAYVTQRDKMATAVEARARDEVVKERSEKELLRLWLSGFATHYDAVDFAFARYALNMAIVECPPERLAGVPAFLVSHAKGKTCGPAMLALAHLARTLGQEIADAGGLSVIAQTLAMDDAPVLTQACLALTGLLELPANRLRFAPHLVQLVALRSRNERVQEAAMGACANAVLGSAANKQLFAELGGLDFVVQCLLLAKDGATVLKAARVIANTAFRSVFAARRAAEHGTALCAAIQACDVLQDDVSSLFTALANCAVDEVTQASIANSEAPELCVRFLVKARDAHVLRAAAHCAAALAYKSLANKARLAQLGLFRACCRVVADEFDDAKIAASLAATTTLASKPNHLLFYDADGLRTFATLCETTEDMPTLLAAARTIAALAPSPGDRWQARVDERQLPFDAQGLAIKALETCRTWNFARTEPPSWLTNALRTDVPDTPPTEPNAPLELFQRADVFEEQPVIVELDHVLAHATQLRDLQFKLY